jgi:hypothetical protein
MLQHQHQVRIDGEEAEKMDSKLRVVLILIAECSKTEWTYDASQFNALKPGFHIITYKNSAPDSQET